MKLPFYKQYHEAIKDGTKTISCRYNLKKWEDYMDECKAQNEIPTLQFCDTSGRKFWMDHPIWALKAVLLSEVTPTEAKADSFGSQATFISGLKKIYRERLIKDYGSVKRGAELHRFALIKWTWWVQGMRGSEYFTSTDTRVGL